MSDRDTSHWKCAKCGSHWSQSRETAERCCKAGAVYVPCSCARCVEAYKTLHSQPERIESAPPAQIENAASRGSDVKVGCSATREPQTVGHAADDGGSVGLRSAATDKLPLPSAETPPPPTGTVAELKKFAADLLDILEDVTYQACAYQDESSTLTAKLEPGGYLVGHSCLSSYEAVWSFLGLPRSPRVITDKEFREAFQRKLDAIGAPTERPSDEPPVVDLKTLMSLRDLPADARLRVWNPAEACGPTSPFEYDQGDYVVVWYDDLYDLVHPRVRGETPAPDRWQPMETAKEYEDVLLADRRFSMPKIGSLRDGRWTTKDGQWVVELYPHAWQPLPPLPAPPARTKEGQ